MNTEEQELDNLMRTVAGCMQLLFPKAGFALIINGSFAEAQEKYELASEETIEVHEVTDGNVYLADHFKELELKDRAKELRKEETEDENG
jgi:hypothetical protein